MKPTVGKWYKVKVHLEGLGPTEAFGECSYSNFGHYVFSQLTPPVAGTIRGMSFTEEEIGEEVTKPLMSAAAKTPIGVLRFVSKMIVIGSRLFCTAVATTVSWLAYQALMLVAPLPQVTWLTAYLIVLFTVPLTRAVYECWYQET